jgi:hypothetical protein
MNVAEQLQQVRERIAAACARAGRDAGEVVLVAVTKTHPAEIVREALAAGQLDFGENYVQELVAKHDAVGEGPRWHYIGHLQRNKVKHVAPWVHLIHTVDALPLAEEIDKRAAAYERHIGVLVQVNVAGEEQKSGCAPDVVAGLLRAASALPHLELRGLMTMPPFWPAEQVRPFFRALRELRERLRGETGLPLPELSMGMSADFEVAVEEGATMVRVGTAIFGAR